MIRSSARSSTRRAVLTLSILFLSVTAAAARQEIEPRPGDRVAWHTVAEGETLSAITQRYLGVADLWPENARLNPSITDPDRLRIGQRLRVIVERPPSERTAEVSLVHRRVVQRPGGNADWTPASVGDQLRRDDAVRTFELSNAELAFDDGHQLVIGERSFVLLRQIGQRLTGEKRQSIELVDGTADLGRVATPQRTADFEILIRGAVARPKPAADGRVASRLRRSDAGAAVMVYDGSSSVESGGASVQVERGMGTSVREGEAPAPPERLLPAPVPVAPRAGSRINYSNPVLSWQEVAGATAYRVEICSSAACSEVLAQAQVTTTSWRPPTLAGGSLAWRVRAVSASGLDGYASNSNRLTLADFSGDGRDLTPPALVVIAQLQGSALGPRKLVVGPQGWLEVAAHDDRSGVQRIQYSWNDGAWSTLRGARLDPPRAEGVHRLALRARDRAGRESAVHQFEVERILQAPEPAELMDGEGVEPVRRGG